MIEFKVKDRDDPCYKQSKPVYRTLKRKGKLYSVEGVEIELFPIRVLAEAIDRKTPTLMKWERQKILPKPMFKVPGKKDRRWYSSVQITNLHRVFFYRHKGRKGSGYNKAAYLDDLRKVFFCREIVVDEQGNMKV